jgi:hypothetical protein
MNERIRELAEQAVLQANEVFDQKGKDYPGIVMEKLAELIVKECARVQHKRFCEHGDVSWDILMQHFGVEE